MNSIIAKVKTFYGWARGFFPAPVPTGVTEFHSWAQSIIDCYKLPTTSERDVKFALATMIMHLGPKDASKSKYSFVLSLRASAAKQIAAAVFQDIKNKQKAEQEALAKKAAEDTATEGQAANGLQQL